MIQHIRWAPKIKLINKELQIPYLVYLLVIMMGSKYADAKFGVDFAVKWYHCYMVAKKNSFDVTNARDVVGLSTTSLKRTNKLPHLLHE